VVVADLKLILSVDLPEAVVEVVEVVPEDLLEEVQEAVGAMVGHDKLRIIC